MLIDLAQTLSLSVTPLSPVVGQEVTFTCTASQDITPGTTVFYRRNRLLVVDFTVTSTSCTSVKGGGGQNYTTTCGSLPVRQTSLTIPADYVTEDEHGTDWRCEIFLGAVSYTVQLTLSVPVSMVTITTDGVYRPSVTISAGNTRTFTCTTTASRPVARLSWFRGDNNITDQAATATDQDMGDDKYTRQQSLTITGRVNDVDSGLKCEAVNIEGRTSVSSQTANVIVQWEPQTDPILTRDPPTTTLTEGVSVTLTCQQTGGKPLATLTWSGVCSGTTPTESSDTTTITSRVLVSVNRTYNGLTCTCVSRHPANSYLRSLNETFVVLFGPDEVHFSGISGQLTETTSMNLVCLSNESNPVPTYTWMNGSRDLPVTSSVLEFDGVYNGKRTSQTWSTHLSRYDDGVVITCVVTSPDRSRHVSATTTLTVLYQPYITVASSPSSPVIEGRQLTITCDVDSYPDSSEFWSSPRSQPSPGTTQTNGVLVIPSVSRHDDGTYRCTATNSQKTNMLDIDITVHYPPDQMTITYNNNIGLYYHFCLSHRTS
ncbi:Nephrin [Mizuhopecten yessoensis]|uniref:Nephrin n=1 Tax=Mizuhopecten yessoensis TaxID=6573 RepID=A0A210R2I3_MIZYE|nr:Nephrin [Mizuhopecten yessoensis]